MKKIIKVLLLLSCMTLKAQVAPILDYIWTIEKIVIDNDTTYAETNFFDEYEILYIQNDETYYSLIFVILVSDLSFDDNEQSFDLVNPAIQTETPPEGITTIGNLFMFNFCAEINSPTNNPFLYDFRNEGDIIYLDITNSEGDVATFWASTLSSSNFEAQHFSIYPNPVTNQLYIESQEAFQRVEVFTINGKRILEANYQENQPMDVSSLPSGMYILKIETENGSVTKKLVKE